MSEEHFVVQGATCKCKLSQDSSKTDKLKVKSQSKHFGNDNGSNKLIATTKELGQTLENNSFGNCLKQPLGNNQYKKCIVNIIQWDNFHEKITLSNQGKKLLENSKATCSMGAPDCIEIVNHGQTAEPGEQNFKNINPMVHNLINPMVDVREMYTKEAKHEGLKFND
ncbi:MAG: DUF4280 domain-containing protein [Flavobacterium nitrogenifigens]|uniref:DUF4280 domain-containing protein n=1 Tax=Flavobacterium nitrogenifigens TaxID=1617283 RepID=UPI0028081F9F|nr:DUF4280 domain-containing protein [Flavobacterium nitrogenifigens]MDQ8011022.1 DUF4280 domain-containing protein [Flavobacterium nitrogenifigens]